MVEIPMTDKRHEHDTDIVNLAHKHTRTHVHTHTHTHNSRSNQGWKVPVGDWRLWVNMLRSKVGDVAGIMRDLRCCPLRIGRLVLGETTELDVLHS